MGQVTLTIGGRNYQIACDDGQEERLHTLTNYIIRRMAELPPAARASGDARLMLMTGLLIADELHEMRDRLTALEGDLSEARRREAQSAEAVAGAAGRLDAAVGRLGG